MSILGYHPVRVTALRTRTIAAIDALAGLHCSDPEAAHPMRVTRLLRQNLEDTWLAALDDIVASTAMCTWRRRTGLVDDAMSHRLARILERLEASPPAAVRRAVAARLDGVLDDLLAALRGDGDLGTSYDGFLAVARSVTDLADRDPAFAAWVAAHIGTDDRWLDVIARLDDVARRGLTPDRASAVHAATFVLAVGGGWWGATPERIETLARHSLTTSAWVDAVTAAPWSVDLAVVVRITRVLVVHATGTATTSTTPPVADAADRTAELLRLVARVPHAAADLLADPDVLTALATSPHLDADAVEAVLAAALGAPALDGASSPAIGLGLLADLVRLTPPGSMSPGAARGTARSLGPFLTALGIHLDARRPVVIPVSDTEHVELGSYDDLAAFFGDVLDDPAAQATLGMVLAAHRTEQRDGAIRSLRDGVERSSAAAIAVIAGHLADTTRILELVVTAREDRDELHAFRHAMTQARTDELLSLVGLVPALVPGRAAPITRQLTTVSTRAIKTAVDASGPARVPDVGIEHDLAIDLTVVALEAPTRDPFVRRALGLDTVPVGAWAEIDALLASISTASGTDERDGLHARLLAVVAASPDLDAYLETVRSISGDARLGG